MYTPVNPFSLHKWGFTYTGLTEWISNYFIAKFNFTLKLKPTVKWQPIICSGTINGF